MCRRSVYLVLCLCVFGLGAARAERVEWIRAAYWDARYPVAWSDDSISVTLRNGLEAAGYEVLNADQLKVWMEARIADGKASVVVFCRDIIPDTVADTLDVYSVLRKYLEAGGKVVSYADIPLYNQGHNGVGNTTWGNNGAIYVLGFNAAGGPWDTRQVVTLTADGAMWGLTKTWPSLRPALPTVTPNLRILAKDSAGNATAWVKHYVAGDTFRGFVRIWDFDVTPASFPPVEDIIRVAEYAGPKASNPDPADGAAGVNLTMWFLKWTGITPALGQRVYIGTDRAAVEAADTSSPEYKGQQAATGMYVEMAPLEAGETYYWRVDVIRPGQVVHTGDVWSFTVTPSTAWAPQPANGAAYVAPDALLEWTAGLNVIYHDVYFGTDRAAVEAGAPETKKASGQAETFYTPAALQSGTTYYWRVDEVVGDTAVAGEVWSFTVQPVTTQVDPTLIGWWKLDDEGSGTAVDYSGWEHHGRLLGGPQWVDGYLAGALSFDGIDDYVDLGAPSDWPAGTARRSMCAWARTAHVGGGYRWIAAYGSAGTATAMFLGMNGTRLYGGGYGSDDIDVWVDGFWEVGVWHHICVTYDGTVARLYADGSEIASGPRTWNLVLGRAHIGRQVNDAAEFWCGEVDDVRLYNEALTPEQVRTIMQGDPLVASNPQPARDAVVDIRSAAALSWSPGATAAKHEVYFGTDRQVVKEAGTGSPEHMGQQTITSFGLAEKVALGGGDYFWRVDEVEAGGTTIHKGDVWKFTIPDSLIVDTFQTYTEDYANVECIYQTWIDGIGFTNPIDVVGNGTGAAVGHPTWDEMSPHYNRTTTEARITVAGSSRSMPLYYDNGDLAKKYYSEAVRTWTAPQDLAAAGVTDLSLWFKGRPVTFAARPDGSYTITSTSGDISSTADYFRFVYKQLSGDGSVSFKLNSLLGTHLWAKAGVMIRETLDPASTRAHMVVSVSRRRAFETRVGAGVAAKSNHSPVGAVTYPVWVKIERKGDQVTGYYSEDGTNWIKQPEEATNSSTVTPNPLTIPMPASVYIGLCITSNDMSAPAIGELSDLTVTGSVTGEWTVADIGPADSVNPANGADDLYVAIQDASGQVGIATWPFATAVTDWTQWKIPLSQFTGVNTSAVTKMFIGVGDRNSPQPDGTGLIYIDDITVVPPQP